ncbi:hypothetical protein ElyMa_004803900 [Elysia marginata]|uniref:Uncharacterized protein n=1 Tax=Elysia marginata TaxID=1093978 RepID=A0AAV4IJ54_9GAST|nr:hypothetical protein ElyMa_004803900 [Elysia marginata]
MYETMRACADRHKTGQAGKRAKQHTDFGSIGELCRDYTLQCVHNTQVVSLYSPPRLFTVFSKAGLDSKHMKQTVTQTEKEKEG